ncbi:MAG: DUF4301 family protein [Deltaproteobacteria bacterium]|nr:DUF4301 family protein [Deltaproteobacteria bacterium]
MATDLGLKKQDLAQIEARGMTVGQVKAIVDKLRRPPKFVALEKAATRYDGVFDLPDVELLAARFGQLRQVPMKFAPMSGAASRMFGFLERVAAGQGKGDDDAKAKRLAAALDPRTAGPRLAFREPLVAALARRGLDLDALLGRGELKPVIAGLIDDAGLGYRGKPKALIPFHLRDGRPVYALEEHLAEAAAYAGNRLHVTISPEHRPLYDAALEEIRRQSPALKKVEIEFSEQHRATDSVAIDAETGALVREGDGTIAFFPAGHGSLLRNIDRLGRPAVLRNVDNVPKPEAARRLVVRWHQAFAVVLADVKAVVAEALVAIDDGRASERLLDGCLSRLEALRVNLFLERLQYRRANLEQKRALMQVALDRPFKIMGVVKNQGEPGGGPFVVNYGGQRIVSIVEKDEIAPEQRSLMADGEFFNPVDLVIDPTDHRGQPYDLTRFVNHNRHFIVRKPYRGRDVIRLEHPGLWNGAMDGWNSLVVAMPIEVFAPVKEVTDLLRPEHQDA